MIEDIAGASTRVTKHPNFHFSSQWLSHSGQSRWESHTCSVLHGERADKFRARPLPGGYMDRAAHTKKIFFLIFPLNSLGFTVARCTAWLPRALMWRPGGNMFCARGSWAMKRDALQSNQSLFIPIQLQSVCLFRTR